MRQRHNPDNRFHLTQVHFDDGSAPLAALHVHEERPRSILAQNESPDVPFRYSLNPYRGCQHACAYCYARPSHQYWGFGAGTDFEREIIAKVNAPELLRQAFDAKRWRGDSLAFSGNTDCYQPLEGRYRLTRRCLEVCAEYKNPVGIITKSALVLQDLDVLQELHRVARVRVFLSIPFADDETGRAIEPGAAPIHRRFETLSALSEAGIETGVSVAPIIPGLNDRSVAEVLRRARDAGARHAFHIALRLPAEVKPVFLERIREALPLAADRIVSAVRDVRGGALSDPRFGERMRGQGPRWKAFEDLFALTADKLGLSRARIADEPTTFERPSAQLSLF